MIFIGSLYPQSLYSQNLKEGTHIDFAAHTFQSSLLEGLSERYDDISVITSPVTSTYPSSKHLFYKSNREYLLTNRGRIKRTIVRQISFFNLPLIKMVSEYVQIKRCLKSILKENETVFIYALHSPFLLAAYAFRYRTQKICVIVPDLPEFMSHNKGLIRKFLKIINKHIIDKCLKSFKNYVLFSKLMETKLPIQGKNIVVVEGIYNPIEIESTSKDTKRTILYTGIINRKYGVFDLIEAFHRIDGDDYQLVLCGSCPTERPELDKYLSVDQRIKYLGMLPTQEVRKLQRYATIVVNPRHSTDEYTKYSFPSKTIEYMASGTPTLMCRLPAIPEDYNKHLFFFEDESVNGYKDRIEELCSMNSDFLSEFGIKAKKFILDNKNCFSQANRICDILEKQN